MIDYAFGKKSNHVQSSEINNIKFIINTYNAAGVSFEQTTRPKCNKFCEQNVNILEFGYYIWNPYENCIQKSPNMPGIG